MPFKSQAQRRKFYAMAERGEIPRSVVEEWERKTPKGTLPERVRRNPSTKGCKGPVFHGTQTASFAKFGKTHKGRTGFHFSDSFDVAASYAGKNAKSKKSLVVISNTGKVQSGNVYAVYLDLGDSLVIDAKGRPWNNIDGKKGSVDHYSKAAKREGYDSLTVKNVSDWGPRGLPKDKVSTTYVVFEPDQIILMSPQRMFEVAAEKKSKARRKNPSDTIKMSTKKNDLGSAVVTMRKFESPYGQLVVMENSPWAGGAHSVYETYVDPKHRGKGEGKRLVKAMLEHYGEGPTIKAQVSSEPSLFLFWDQGFRGKSLDRAVREFEEDSSTMLTRQGTARKNPSPKPLDPALYEEVRESVKSRVKVWPSAYASAQVVQEYKRRGGRYAGKKPTKSGLPKWFKEDWVDLSRPLKKGGFAKCGRPTTGMSQAEFKRTYPKCVPASKAARMSPAEIKSAVARKRAAEKKKPRGQKSPTYVRTNPAPRFLGPCDRVRRRKGGEEFWQEAMRTGKKISERTFLANVDVSPLLDEDETWADWRDDVGEEIAYYRSPNAYYITTPHGFEFLWSREGEKR